MSQLLYVRAVGLDDHAVMPQLARFDVCATPCAVTGHNLSHAHSSRGRAWPSNLAPAAARSASSPWVGPRYLT